MTVTSIHGRFVVGYDGHDHCLVPDGEVVFRDWTPGNLPQHQLFRPSFPVVTDLPTPASGAGDAG